MQFQVPQFIDVEDKIIGPMTLKQFLFIAGAGALSFMTFFAFAFWLWIVVTVLASILAVTLAFVRFNGRPMIVMLGAMFKYLWKPKLYLWRHSVDQKSLFSGIKIEKLPASSAKTAGTNPLKKLFLRLNTSKEAVAGREKASPVVTQLAIKNKMNGSGGEVAAKSAF